MFFLNILRQMAQAFFRFRIEVLRGLIFLNVKQYLLTLNSRLKGSPDLSFIFHSSVELWQCRNGFERQNNWYFVTKIVLTYSSVLNRRPCTFIFFTLFPQPVCLIWVYMFNSFSRKNSVCILLRDNFCYKILRI